MMATTHRVGLLPKLLVAVLAMGALFPGPSALAQEPKAPQIDTKETTVAEAIAQLGRKGTKFYKAGDYEQAAPLFRKALELAVATYGEQSREARGCRLDFLFVAFEMGLDEEFAELIEAVLHEAQANPPQFETVTSISILEAQLGKCGDIDLPKEKHEALLARLIEGSALVGKRHEFAARTAQWRYYAKTRQPLKAIEEMRTLIAKAIQKDLITRGLAEVRMELAIALACQGEQAQAEKEMDAAFAWLQGTQGARLNAELARAQRGEVLALNGKYTEALPELEAGLAAATQWHQDKGSFTFVRALYTYATVLKALARHEDAQRAFEDAKAALQSISKRKTYDFLELEKKLAVWPRVERPTAK